ncbi:hypothetical protein, partial [Pseudomonas mosselii]|uniref:hypothetical protein n=1 Tax=Pseudomonas mosselii TaxID=78327 RepID=UPI001A7E14E1
SKSKSKNKNKKCEVGCLKVSNILAVPAYRGASPLPRYSRPKLNHLRGSGLAPRNNREFN